MVLRGRQGDAVGAVHQREEGGLLAVQELLDDDLGAWGFEGGWVLGRQGFRRVILMFRGAAGVERRRRQRKRRGWRKEGGR
jgi:hypothetical protein